MAKEPTNRELKRLIARINNTKKPSAKTERASTASNGVKSYDVSAAAAKPKAKGPPRTLQERIKRNLRAREARDTEHMTKVTEAKAARYRQEVPEPLPALLAPPLPPFNNGKPNAVALIYAYRAFQQYSRAFTIRNLGNHREVYYQNVKKQFREALKDLGFDDLFDWSEF